MLLAGSSLLTLLDDIATLLDDISVMGKLAAKKTAGVLGDDLSLNAQQVSGVRANRELPVVWGVAKGSLINKVILVPLALIISAFIPWAITPLLMIGGAFLCFEGVEKVLHMLEARKHKEDPAQSQQRLEKLAAQAESVAKISSTCTVFAESEVISQLAGGGETPDLVAGICQSVAARVASLAKRIGIREEVCMSGGVARNGGVRSAMEKELGVRIRYSPLAQFMGALGAALYGWDQADKGQGSM